MPQVSRSQRHNVVTQGNSVRDLQAQTPQQEPALPIACSKVVLQLLPLAAVLLRGGDGAAISKAGEVAVNVIMATQPGHGNVLIGRGMVGLGTRLVMQVATVATRQLPHGTLAAGVPLHGAATMVSSGAKAGTMEVTTPNTNKTGSGAKAGRIVRMMRAKAMIGNGNAALLRATEHLGEGRNSRFEAVLKNSADRGEVPDIGGGGGTESARIQKTTGLLGGKVSFCAHGAVRTVTVRLAM
mmetsp:Transcript_136290/g.271828  ORF Transcript_136290/g.271828 Transcript_136290/m.271828 type:complete len:240 (+) Transcript_136290:66-785(+)